MSLTRHELYDIRTYIANCGAKELEYSLTQEIGDQEEYYDAEPQLCKLIPKLDEEDLWQLVRLAQSILNDEVVAELPEGFPRYEISTRHIGDLEITVQEANGTDYHSYGHKDVLNQLIAYGFVKVK